MQVTKETLDFWNLFSPITIMAFAGYFAMSGNSLLQQVLGVIIVFLALIHIAVTQLYLKSQSSNSVKPE